MIIFCQGFENLDKKCERTSLDKEKLEFGRLQTVVWTKGNYSFYKENYSLDKGKLKQTNIENIK